MLYINWREMIEGMRSHGQECALKKEQMCCVVADAVLVLREAGDAVAALEAFGCSYVFE